MFSIAICRPTGFKWQSKHRFLAIFDRIRQLLRAFSIAAFSVSKPISRFKNTILIIDTLIRSEYKLLFFYIFFSNIIPYVTHANILPVDTTFSYIDCVTQILHVHTTFSYIDCD